MPVRLPEPAVLLALLLTFSAQAGCDKVLDLLLRHAERAFVEGNADGVAGAAIDARNSVGCVDTPLTNHEAARIHRAEALAAYLKGNTARTDALLAAMVHADPWLGVSDLVEPSHPLAVRLVYVEERGAADTRTLLWPESGLVHVDGVPSAIAPAGQPWVYQQVKATGSVVRSQWVDVGESPPALVGAIGDRARMKNGWKLTGATMVLVGGGLGIGAWSEGQRMNRALVAQDPGGVRDAESSRNALTIGSIVTGAAGAGLVVVGFAL